MPDGTSSPVDDPRFIPAIDLIRRTGARDVQIRYSDDEEPVVWFVIASYSIRGGKPVSSGKINARKVGAAFDPLKAVFRFLDDALDGGQCVHCGRVTGFEPSIGPMPLDELVCWYQWDPELRTFRRGCEGD
jgi:hypothetical protein